MSKMKDLSGLRFGRLLALFPVGKDRHGSYMWECRCDCGNTKIVRSGNLVKGGTTSCGCLLKETTSANFKVHGKSRGDKLYRVWVSMNRRCRNTREKNYGARGITVCEDWADDFASFEKWSMQNGYSEGLQLDRKDNDKGYSPDNCRWVTRTENLNNKRSNVRIISGDEDHTLAEWSRITGINAYTISARINAGWTVEKALTTPLRKKERITKDGTSSK